MLVYSESLSLYKTLYETIHESRNTLVVSYVDVFGYTISVDVWIRYTISNNKDTIFGHVVE